MDDLGGKAELKEFLDKVPTRPSAPEVLYAAQVQDKDLDEWLISSPASDAPSDEAPSWYSTYEASLKFRWRRSNRNRSN